MDTVKLFTIPQILRDSLLPEPFIKLSLFASAMLQTDSFQLSHTDVNMHHTTYTWYQQQQQPKINVSVQCITFWSYDYSNPSLFPRSNAFQIISYFLM